MTAIAPSATTLRFEEIAVRVRQRLGTAASEDEVSDVARQAAARLGVRIPTTRELVGFDPERLARQQQVAIQGHRQPPSPTAAVARAVVEATGETVENLATFPLHFAEAAATTFEGIPHVGQRPASTAPISSVTTDSRPGLGDMAVGVARMGYDLQSAMMDPNLTATERARAITGMVLNTALLGTGAKASPGATTPLMRRIGRAIRRDVQNQAGQTRGPTSARAVVVRQKVEADAPEIIASETRGLPTNGVQDVAEIGVRPATEPPTRSLVEPADLGGRMAAGRARVAERATETAEVIAERRAIAEGRVAEVEAAQTARLREPLAGEPQAPPAPSAPPSTAVVRHGEYQNLLRLGNMAGREPSPDAFGIQKAGTQPYPSIEAMLADLGGRGGPPPRNPPQLPSGAGASGPYRSTIGAVEDFYTRTEHPLSRTVALLDTLRRGGRRRFVLFEQLRDPLPTPFTAEGAARIAGQAATFKDSFFAPAREALRQLMDAQTVANGEAANVLHGIVQGLNRADLDLLRRTVVTLDLQNSGTRGVALPKGLTAEMLQAERVRLEGLVRQNPRVQEALSRHVRFISTVEADLVQRGIIGRETVEANPYYFHHQTMDWLSNYFQRGTGKSARRAALGFTEQRRGGSDFYTDYLEVMYGHYARVFRHNRIDDGISRIATQYDLRANPIRDRLDALSRRVGEYQNGSRELPRRYSSAPASVLQLPEADLAEFGYAWYDLGPRRTADGARGLAEQTMARGLHAMAEEPEILDAMGVNRRMFQDALNANRERYALLPEELTNTLSNYRTEFAPESYGFITQLTRQWKQFVLQIKPGRYNRRNLLGDLERTNAGQPSAIRLFPRVIRDQINHQRNLPTESYVVEGRSAPRYQLAEERSVVSSGRLALEVGGLRQLEEFARFADKAAAARNPATWVRRYFHGARRLSQFREDWLRLASFYDNLDRIAASKPLRYGVSNRAIVDALPDPIDRAAKISRELLGDYGNFTAFENSQWMRNGLVPFYAWLQINSSYWPALLARQGIGPAFTGGALTGARAAASVAARVGAVYAAIWTWNNIVMGDVENSLPRDVRDRPFHVNTPFTAQGKRVVVTDPSALDDFLVVAGLDGATVDLRAMFSGQLSVGEYVKRQAGRVATGVPRAITQRFGPEIQAAAAAAGYTLYPDAFRPRPLPPETGRLAAAAEAVGVPRGIVDVAEGVAAGVSPGAVARAGVPRVSTVLDILPSPLGIRQVGEPAMGMDAIEAEAYFRLQREINELHTIQGRYRSMVAGISMPGLTRPERELQVAILEKALNRQVVRVDKAASVQALSSARMQQLLAELRENEP